MAQPNVFKWGLFLIAEGNFKHLVMNSRMTTNDYYIKKRPSDDHYTSRPHTVAIRRMQEDMEPAFVESPWEMAQIKTINMVEEKWEHTCKNVWYDTSKTREMW